MGAGPAGAHAARRLAELGRAVALVDENPGPRDEVVCSGIVGLEALGRFEIPSEAVVDAVEGSRFSSPSGVTVSHAPDAGLARVLDRTLLDGGIAEAAARSGARVLRGLAARGLERDGDGIRLRLRRAGGDGDRGPRGAGASIAARALVVATGNGRWLHGEAGLGAPRGYVQGIHAEVPFEGLDGAEIYFGNDVAPGHFAWAVPYREGARLGLLAPQGGRRLFARFVRSGPVRERLGVPPDEAAARERVMSRGIVQGPVLPSVADRVVAVGEAAGQVKTTTGGGIYYGMLGAEIAAEVLDRALRRDRLDAASLSAYQERWLAELGPEIRLGLALQRAARRLEDPQIDSLFRALGNGLGGALRGLVSFDWHGSLLRRLLSDRRFRRLAAGGTA